MAFLLFPAAASLAGPGDDGADRVRNWVEILESPSSPAKKREIALSRLKNAATGDPKDPVTHAAIFALPDVYSSDGDVPSPAALDAMISATALYPNDPRSPAMLRRLCLGQIAAGESFRAHLFCARYLQREDAPTDESLLVRAAANAADAGDMTSAFSWIDRLDSASVPKALRTSYWLVRLKASVALGRQAEALLACEQLDAIAPDDLRADAPALLAAAKTEEAAGRLEAAAQRYESFVNVYTRSPERAGAMLALARLQIRLNRPAAAGRTLDWIAGDYPDSHEADLAGLERLELDPSLPDSERVRAYLSAANSSTHGAGALEACSRLADEMLEKGEPLRLISALSGLALEGRSMGSVAARQVLAQHLDPMLADMESRGDDVELVAAAAEIELGGRQIPTRHRGPVNAARERLGLFPASPRLEDMMTAARAHARQGRWQEVRMTLEPVMRSPLHSTTLELKTERLVAEALWREGRREEALARIDAAIRTGDPENDRPLQVLRADILFAGGERDSACLHYRAALEVAASPWVERQVEVCDSAAGPAKESSR